MTRDCRREPSGTECMSHSSLTPEKSYQTARVAPRSDPQQCSPACAVNAAEPEGAAARLHGAQKALLRCQVEPNPANGPTRTPALSIVLGLETPPSFCSSVGMGICKEISILSCSFSESRKQTGGGEAYVRFRVHRAFLGEAPQPGRGDPRGWPERRKHPSLPRAPELWATLPFFIPLLQEEENRMVLGL